MPHFFSLIFTFALFYSQLSAQSPVAVMSIEEKVGQVLMVHFHGEEANDEAQYLIQKLHIGAFIYYEWSNGLSSPQQVANLSQGLQRLAMQTRLSLPLIIAIDQEGGPVCRLKGEGFTPIPANQVLAASESPEMVEQYAYTIGKELLSVGVNMNLAPVVDINGMQTRAGQRSYGNSPELVAALGKKALDGYRHAGVISCLKHFPGVGDWKIDPHENLPIVEKSKPELQQWEFIPYYRLAPEADAIMTAHVLVPALDPKYCATVSKDILGLLRNNMQFHGVIVSDSLVMEGILKNIGSVEEAAIASLNAGCDLLILGGKQLIGAHANMELMLPDIIRLHAALVQAVKSGKISEGRLNQAVESILSLKQKLNLFSVPSAVSIKIADKIWKNECNGTVEGLTSWNEGEQFASLGIGHFIWYPQNHHEVFDETFPSLIGFIKMHNASIPAWLIETKSCPWKSREAFYREINSEKMNSLRQFLVETKELQAMFIVSRLEHAIGAILAEMNPLEIKRIRHNFYRLAHSPNGLYALIDYSNFKGMGTTNTETYNGKGWGLLQVLEEMPEASDTPVADFAAAAKRLLTLRVANAPKDKSEERWLKGWMNRLATYTNP